MLTRQSHLTRHRVRARRPARQGWAKGRRAPGGTGGGRAFTMVEMLISLAIIGMLLAAVAMAMHGVLLSYRENAKIAEVVQAARVVLHRMMSEVRTADAIDTDSSRLSIIPPVNAEGITQIQYQLADGVLTYQRTISGQESSQPLIATNEDVQLLNFSVSRQTAVDGEGQTYTRSVTAQLTLKSGENVFPVTASACPRRNLPY